MARRALGVPVRTDRKDMAVRLLTSAGRRTRHLAVGLAALVFVVSAQAEPIRGAGSTFAAPIIEQWSRAYEAGRADGGDYVSPDWRVDYERVGSLAGIMRLAQPDMDFAATDAPLAPEEIGRRGWAQFPIVMGGVVVVTSIDKVATGRLRLTGALLADIYLGKIRNWSDAAIRTLNPDLDLPDATIEVLHRQDGSGSTFAFTSLLAKASPEWRDKLGADTVIRWPVGRGETGTGGLAALAAATRNSITYLEYGQVVRAGLPFALLQNRAGAFVRPEPASFGAALAGMDWQAGRHFQVDPIDAAGPGAYPLATVTYAVLPGDRGAERVGRVLDLFRLAFGRDPDGVRALGYIPVSPELARQIGTYWAAFQRPAGR